MGWPIRCASLAALFLLGSAPTVVRAQGGMNIGQMAMPSMGPVSPQTGTLAGMSTQSAAPAKSDDPALGINDTFVSFIDSAVPRNIIGMRFDATYNNRQPMR